MEMTEYQICVEFWKSFYKTAIKTFIYTRNKEWRPSKKDDVINSTCKIGGHRRKNYPDIFLLAKYRYHFQSFVNKNHGGYFETTQLFYHV